jgi:hypothetical protein
MGETIIGRLPEPIEGSQITEMPHQRPGLLMSPGPLLLIPDELFSTGRCFCPFLHETPIDRAKGSAAHPSCKRALPGVRLCLRQEWAEGPA